MDPGDEINPKFIETAKQHELLSGFDTDVDFAVLGGGVGALFVLVSPVTGCAYSFELRQSQFPDKLVYATLVTIDGRKVEATSDLSYTLENHGGRIKLRHGTVANPR